MNTTQAGASGAAAALPTQYLTFSLAGETFGLGILAVKEIIEYRGVTEVPMMPTSIRGVINLRGAVVPVMDLIARFGKPSSSVGRRTCIVIVETELQGEAHVIGVIVDAVSEVLDIAPEDIEPAPGFGMQMHRAFVAGIGKVRGKFVILLDAERVLSIEDVAALAHLSPALAAA